MTPDPLAELEGRVWSGDETITRVHNDELQQIMLTTLIDSIVSMLHYTNLY